MHSTSAHTGRNNPRTEFVARFLGEMNWLSGTVRGHAAGLVDIDWAGTTIRARRREAYGIGTGATCHIAMRPEDIGISGMRPGGEQLNLVRGVMTERVFRGSEMHYVVDVTGNLISVSARQHDVRGHETDVWLAWEPHRTLLMR